MTASPRTDHAAAGDGAQKDTQDARQGATTGHMRWVLRISLVLGVLAMAGAYVGLSVSKHHPLVQPAPATAASGAPGSSAG